MDDTTRASTGPPVPTKFPMRRVEGLPLEEQRTFAGVFPVVRQRANESSNVTSILARRLEETTFPDMVMWLDCPMPPDKAGTVVAFTPEGTFVPHLLDLIDGLEIDGRHYKRFPKWDGTRRCDADGRYTIYLVMEMSAGARPLPFMTRDVRFVFGDRR